MKNLTVSNLPDAKFINIIIRLVGNHFGVTPAAIKGRRRPAKFCTPRSIAMYLSCILAEATLVEIGAVFGGKDHGTIIHAREKVIAKMEIDPETKALVERFVSRLKRIKRRDAVDCEEFEEGAGI